MPHVDGLRSIVAKLAMVLLHMLHVLFHMLHVLLHLLSRMTMFVVITAISMLRILHVDVVYVSLVAPTDGAIEIVGCPVALPLLAREHTLELLVALVPHVRVDVAVAVDTIEISQVDIENATTLGTGESQFGHHAVGDKTCFGPNASESLSANRCEHHHRSEDS